MDDVQLAAFVDELEKVALTRSVQEWRKANAGGDAAGAAQIAQGHAQLGAKPRYLEDISLGGEEAGVDKMMGHAGAQAPAAPGVQQRLEQYKANKSQLGAGQLQGRAPTPSVMSSPEGRSALLRGTQAAPQTPAPNESGLMARKLYKPDSRISRGEFTPQLLAQKQTMTDTARSLSPEAKNMVPAMYGHQTSGTGGLQRSTSTHEFVPGLSDLRSTPSPHMAMADVENKVLNPMLSKGMRMADTGSSTGGINYGNVVNSPSGPKVLDFLPSMRGQDNPALESFKKYAPTHTEFADKVRMAPGQYRPGTQGSMGALRKEVFNPKMQINAASPEMHAAAREHMKQQLLDTSTSSAAHLATSAATPLSHAPTAVPGAVSNAFSHAPTALSGMGGKAVSSAESAVTKVPGMLRRAGGALSHAHI